MKVVFVGPSLPQAAELFGSDIEIRPPAVQGDILRAVKAGASAIGLIDGNFEYVAPVWHKEILFALSEGVRIYGAASMGALRAAECAAFGMVGIGRIYEGYASGRLIDDSDVALLHGPEELRWISLSVPMVNVLATLESLSEQQAITQGQSAALRQAAEGLFYKDRTWRAVVKAASVTDQSTNERSLIELLRSATIDVKATDSLLLLQEIAKIPTECRQKCPDWQFHPTSMWKESFV